MIGGPYWAYGFAWSIAAVLAQHWDEPGLGVRELTFPVAFNSDPGLGASFKNAVFFVEGNVVFSLAGDYTGLATGASIKIDDHAPASTVEWRHFSIGWDGLAKGCNGCCSGRGFVCATHD